MGRESRAKAIRKCNSCGDEMRGTAKEIQEHANICGRIRKLGLEYPTLIAAKKMSGVIVEP